MNFRWNLEEYFSFVLEIRDLFWTLTEMETVQDNNIHFYRRRNNIQMNQFSDLNGWSLEQIDADPSLVFYHEFQQKRNEEILGFVILIDLWTDGNRGIVTDRIRTFSTSLIRR